MFIKSIDLENSPLFGKLSFSFQKENSEQVHNTIVIAGENGVGKTSLLNIIFDSLNFELPVGSKSRNKDFQKSIKNGHNFESRTITYKLSKKESDLLAENIGTDSYTCDGELVLKFVFREEEFPKRKYFFPLITFSDDKNVEDNKNIINCLKKISTVIYNEAIFFGNEPPFFFNDSAARSSDNIKNVIRAGTFQSGIESIDTASEVSQYIFDLFRDDTNELFQRVKKSNDNEITINKADVNKRVDKLINAFSEFIGDIKFDRVENLDLESKLVFNVLGKDVFIERLSSGEKQVLFRGAILLRNRTRNNNVVIIDEPEISLHLRWQIKISGFYKSILTDENGQPNAQLFISTHSPFIIHDESLLNDKLIMLEKDKNLKKIKISSVNQYYGWEPEKIIESAFKISEIINDRSEIPIVFVEGITDEEYLTDAYRLFWGLGSQVRIKCIGKQQDGKSEGSGDTALTQAIRFLSTNQQFIKSKVFFLYDTDVKVQERIIEKKIFIMKMNENKENLTYKKGIENLLNLSSDFPFEDFYEESPPKYDDYGAKIIRQSLAKTKLCKYILNLELDRKKIIYEKLKETLEMVINKLT